MKIADKLRHKIEEDFVQDVDGYYIYWATNAGALTEQDLTSILYLLRKRNLEHDIHLSTDPNIG